MEELIELAQLRQLANGLHGRMHLLSGAEQITLNEVLTMLTQAEIRLEQTFSTMATALEAANDDSHEGT